MPKNATTETFAERLADLIADRNISLDKIGKEIGVSKSTLSKYTNDEAEAPIGTLVKLANYFNVSADYLIGISEAKTNNKDLQFICDYTGLSNETIETLHKESCRETFLNGILQKTSNVEEYTGIDMHKTYLKSKNEFINSEHFEEILSCITTDSFLAQSLEVLKIKAEAKEASKTDAKAKTARKKMDVDLWILTSTVSDWQNKHRLNLFNAQDALVSFIKEHTGIEKLDRDYFNNKIEEINADEKFYLFGNGD